jgi:N-methylhydantoinase B
MTMLHAGNGGMCFIDSVELDEIYTPILVRVRRLIRDSEGAGRLRGAPGILVELGPVGCAMEAVFVADGNINNPKGVRGGLPAAPSEQWLVKRSGSRERLPQFSQLMLEDGEWLVSVACGGGGYGDPRTRDVARVLNDVREGLVSRERAQAVYGVAITPELTLDDRGTRALRGA